jgi:hypothetical protein
MRTSFMDDPFIIIICLDGWSNRSHGVQHNEGSCFLLSHAGFNINAAPTEMSDDGRRFDKGEFSTWLHIKKNQVIQRKT